MTRQEKARQDKATQGTSTQQQSIEGMARQDITFDKTKNKKPRASRFFLNALAFS
jgi:hypothetical protein